MDRIFTIGLSLVAYDKMSGILEGAVGKSIAKFNQLQERIKRVSERLAELGTVSYFAGQQMIATMTKPVTAYSELEDALTRARVAFMTAGGEVDSYFSEIEKVAKRLGTELPGTTRDFTLMASRLKEVGIASETIARGGLEATAYLRVLMGDLAPEQAAEMTATFSQSLGIAKEEFVSFVDLIQRAKFAFGLDPQVFAYTLKYIGPIAKQLGIMGLEGSKSLIALSGLLSQAGIKGEQLGTSLRSVLLELPGIDEKIKKSKEISEILQRYGIGLMFFKEGKFLGIENLIYQLEKLKALTTEERIEVIKRLFGTETASALSEAIGRGLKGLTQANEEIARQASLQERLNAVMGTFKNLWEAATGTFTNALAAVGGAISGEIKWVAKAFNSISEFIADFAENHKTLTRILGVGTLAIGGLLVALGALGIALSVIMRVTTGAISGFVNFIGFTSRAISWIKLKTAAMWNLIYTQIYLDRIQYRGGFYQAMQYWLMTTKLRMLQVIGATQAWVAAKLLLIKTTFLTLAGIKAFAGALWIGLLGGLKAAIVAIKAFGIALLTTPIGWLGLAIATAALLIYKFWKPISGFFSGLWQGIKEGLKGLEPAFGILNVVIAPLKFIYNLFKGLITPIEDTGRAAENLGLKFGRVIGDMLSAVLTLPTKMYAAGQNLINSLWQGIVSMASAPINAVAEIAGKIRNLLPFSPAKEGPLATLHQVKLIETITEGISADPLIAKLQEVLGQAGSMLLQPLNAGLLGQAGTPLQQAHGIGAPAGGGMYAGAMHGGGMVININNTITVNASGDGGDVTVLAERVANETSMQIDRALRRKYTA